MNIDVVDKNGFCLIRIKDDLLQETDLGRVKSEVQSQLDNGIINIAVSFTPKSYFHSRTQEQTYVRCVLPKSIQSFQEE